MNKIIQPVIRNPMLHHGLFWAVSFYVLLNIFSLSSSFQRIDYIYTSIFLISILVPVLINLYVFIPRFLRKGKYLVYALLFLALLLFFAWLNQVIFSDFIDLVFPGYFFISYYSYGDIVKFFGVFLILTTLLHLSKEWFELNHARQQMILLEKEKVNAELRALANQVNPHFLFNSLNVLYALAVEGRKESPEAILKLSDILRYVIYDSSGDRTPVSSEVQLIKNYIDLQLFRTGNDSAINFHIENNNPGLMLAPMLLLPLVENGFKHGIKGDISDTFLNIQLKVNGDKLEFAVENNKGHSDAGPIPGNSGVGLENIRSRLQLLYPGNHELIIDDAGSSFRVKLVITNLPEEIRVTGKQ